MALMYPVQDRCYRSLLFRGVYMRAYTHVYTCKQTHIYIYIHRRTVIGSRASARRMYTYTYNVVELYQHLLWKSFSSWLAKRERERLDATVNSLEKSFERLQTFLRLTIFELVERLKYYVWCLSLRDECLSKPRWVVIEDTGHCGGTNVSNLCQ